MTDSTRGERVKNGSAILDANGHVCAPCEGGVTKLDLDQIAFRLKNLPGWRVTDNGTRLTRTWRMQSFLAGMAFLNDIADLAELERHHPDLHLEGYSTVRVDLYTHSVGGLTDNDFALAARIVELPLK